jgi:hypothetical protein
MHHVGDDVDAGNEAAAKSETASHGVVMDLVLGKL